MSRHFGFWYKPRGGGGEDGIAGYYYYKIMPELNRAGIAANDQRLPNLSLTPSIPSMHLPGGNDS
jgi:hypothetical protein